MSETPDFNIKNYSLNDLIELIGPSSTQTRESIRVAVNNAIRQFKSLKNTGAVEFFKEVSKKLLNNFDKLQPIIDSLDQQKITDGENVFQNEYYDNGDATNFLAESLPNRQNNVSVLEPSNHMTLGQRRLLIPNTHDVNTVQGNMNPTLKNNYVNLINVDSQFREIKNESIDCSGTIDSSNTYLGTSTDFTFDLSEPMNNVSSISVGSIEIPRAWYPFNDQYGTTSFSIFDTGQNIVRITPGFYDRLSVLTATIQTSLPVNYVIDICANTLRTTIKNIGTDFRLNFITDISGCDLNNSGAKIDCNLGWMLGFRQPRYPMVGEPTDSYTSEGLVDNFGTRYLFLKVNDYQSNRITGGIVSLTDNQDKFKLPSYYRQIQASQPFCEDVCGNVVQRTGKNAVETVERECRKGTQNPSLIIKGVDNLTSAQKYTAQQIVINRKNINQDRYFAPTPTDILLRFPVDRDSVDRTIPMIQSNDGTQKRTYFGPTTLTRLRVQLLDDRGFVVDLSNMNFSFSLIVEQLYQY